MERLVAGRERIYLDRFWNELSADPRRSTRRRARITRRSMRGRGAMHDAFEQFAAFAQDAIDNQAFLAKGKLAMPVLAIGGEKSFGTGHGDRDRLRRHRREKRVDRRIPATG